MTWLDKLERRFGFLGIPGLIRIVIGFTALVYVLVFLNRGFESFLTLDPALILRGQVWRLVTYIFLPQTFSPLWVLLALWFLWFIGEGLERAWGAVPADALFRRRDDWHDHRGILFRRQFLQWHAHHVIVLRIRALLSRGSHLHSFYFARKNQMAGVDLRRVFDARVFSGTELVSRGAHCRIY